MENNKINLVNNKINLVNNKINSINNKIYNIIFYAFTIIIILVGLYYLINKTNLVVNNNQKLNTYTIQQIPKGNSSENMDICKHGCVRGRCKNKDTTVFLFLFIIISNYS